MTNETLRKWTAIIVIAGWSIALVEALITQNIIVLGAVTPIMMFVMGFLYGFKPRNGNGG